METNRTLVLDQAVSFWSLFSIFMTLGKSLHSVPTPQSSKDAGVLPFQAFWKD